jgi:ketopantoate reductase
MQILIVGVGALGGTIAARAIRSGLPVRLAARNNDSAKALRRSGLRLSGIGGEVRADAIDVAAVEDYGKGDQFDLILLATKAQDALEVAPHGLLYISDLLLNRDLRNLERYDRYAEEYGTCGIFKLPEGAVVRHHREEWIEELTGSFGQLEFEPFEVTTMNGNKSAAFQYLGRAFPFSDAYV